MYKGEIKRIVGIALISHNTNVIKQGTAEWDGSWYSRQVQSMKSSYSQQLIKFNAQFLSSLAFDSLTLTFPTLYLGSFDLAGISEL